MIIAISNIEGKPKLDTSIYSCSLNPEELIDWMGEMENFYEFEKIRDLRRVRVASTKLKPRIGW